MGIDKLSSNQPEPRGSEGFGTSWEQLNRPVKTVIGAIDPELMPQIGLTAMQIRNLDLQTKSPPATVLDVEIMVETNREHIPDHRRYDSVTLAFQGKTVEAEVFNAFGELAPYDRDSIRISKGAADILGISPGDIVEIL